METEPERPDAGFTLIELLIVVVVLGIVATIAIVALFNALDKAKQRATMADMRSLAEAIHAYEVDNGRAPDSSGGVASLNAVLVPYVSNVAPITDHWGHGYAYTSDAQGNYTVESYGKDGVDGSNISVTTRFEFDRDIVLSDGLFVASPE